MANKRNLCIADGRVTTTAAEVTAGPSDEGGRVNATFTNTNANDQVLTLTYSRDGGTDRAFVRVTLEQYWRLEVAGLPMNRTDSLKAVVDHTSLSVDYLVSVAAEAQPFAVRVYDAAGGVAIGGGALDSIAESQEDAAAALGNLDDIADAMGISALNQQERQDLLLACLYD